MKKIYFLLAMLITSLNVYSQSITLTPTSAGINTAGKMYYDNVENIFKYWNGTSYVPIMYLWPVQVSEVQIGH